MKADLKIYVKDYRRSKTSKSGLCGFLFPATPIGFKMNAQTIVSHSRRPAPGQRWIGREFRRAAEINIRQKDNHETPQMLQPAWSVFMCVATIEWPFLQMFSVFLWLRLYLNRSSLEGDCKPAATTRHRTLIWHGAHMNTTWRIFSGTNCPLVSRTLFL